MNFGQSHEHRIGLKPIYRKVWIPWFEVPIAKIKWQYKWVWLYGFVCPESGKTYWWVLPKVNSTIFSKVLEDFATYFGLGKNRQVILVLDGARWHTTKSLKIPEGIHLGATRGEFNSPTESAPLELLPSYSPELQPAERLWPLTNEPIVNRFFDLRVRRSFAYSLESFNGTAKIY
ncbi:transposase [Moorena bouillonii]|uniref:transposase n=1 Tax=Moorena bouillonii TaxID=207920 RepID=UPI000A79C7D5